MLQYDITSNKAPQMPSSWEKIPILKLILSQTPEAMRPLVANGCFPALANFMYDIEFKYPDRTYMTPYCIECGCAHSGAGKSALTRAIAAITRKQEEHDKQVMKDRARQDQQLKNGTKEKGKKKEPIERAPMPLWIPDSDISRPAMVQNAMDLEETDNHPMLILTPEIDMLNQMCGGHRMVSKAIRIFGDGGRWGQVRATPDGITGQPIMRVNICATGTEETVTEFFRKDLHNGTLWRFGISYLPRERQRRRTIPRQGSYDAKAIEKLNEILQRLESCHGKFEIKPLNKLIDSLAGDMADLADLCDDNNIEDMSHRTLVNAWKKGCILWLANGQSWSKAIGEIVTWSIYHDLWSKTHLFSELLKNSGWASSHKGPVANMLDSLKTTFSELELEELRKDIGKNPDAKDQLRAWRNRGFITFDETTQLYTKTEAYLANHPQQDSK